MNYDWVESQADRLSSDQFCLGEEEVQEEGDRAPEPPRRASVDALEAILERTYNLLNRPKLHAHACCKCFHLQPCVQQPCAYRATDLEREWDCGCALVSCPQCHGDDPYCTLCDGIGKTTLPAAQEYARQMPERL